MKSLLKYLFAGAIAIGTAGPTAAQERVVDFYFLDPSSVTLTPDDLNTLYQNNKFTVEDSGGKNNYLCKMSTMTLTSEGVTLKAESNGGSHPRFFWQGGTENDTDDLFLCDFRTYDKNIITITAPEGCTVTKIVMYPKGTNKNKATCCNMIIVDAACGGKQTITANKNQWAADGDGLQKVTFNVKNPNSPDKAALTQSVYRMYVTLKGTASISDIAADNPDAPVEYFDISGRPVKPDNLSPGLYIRRRGQKTEKMLVKPGLNQ